MKTIDDFRNFVDTVLTPDLRVIEAQRRRVLCGLLLFTVAVIAGMAAAATAYFSLGSRRTPLGQGLWATFGIMSPFLIAGGYRALFRLIGSRYAAHFGEIVLSRTAKFIDARLEYAKDFHVDGSRLRMSNLFERSPEILSGSDMVFGKAGPVEMMCSFVCAQYRVQPLPTRPPQIRTMFNGVFCALTLEKNLGKEMFVMARSSAYPQDLNSAIRSLEPVADLPNNEFNRTFSVYYGRDIRTRPTLTEAAAKDILEFSRTMKKKVHIALAGNRVSVAVESALNPLAVPLFRSPMRFDFLRRYYEVLAFPLRLGLDLTGT